LHNHERVSYICLHMQKPIEITFLGTGTSQGVPVISCKCNVCTSADARDNRLRSSILISIGDSNFVVDTGPDFRQQMLQNKVDNIRAILYTHEHKDHVAGLDDIRPYNFNHHKPIDVFAESRVLRALKREYSYIFALYHYPGIPEVNMNRIGLKPFSIDDVEFYPIRVFHHKLPILGFRVGNFAYLTDIKTISDKEKSKLKNLDTIVVTTLRKEEHISHMNLDEALLLIKELQPQRSYLTHLSHRFGLHAEEEPKLPSGVFIAYDGLKILV
jgi:phosphoribosyl 1,2-cyclic phosphate phosphodiesterase